MGDLTDHMNAKMDADLARGGAASPAPICKGSLALGTGCGRCVRCREEQLQHLRKVAALVQQEGAARVQTAGMSGSHHDGGGAALQREVAAFLAGLDRRLPAGWEPFSAQARRETDRDWPEFQRLKAKFEGGGGG